VYCSRRTLSRVASTHASPRRRRVGGGTDTAEPCGHARWQRRTTTALEEEPRHATSGNVESGREEMHGLQFGDAINGPAPTASWLVVLVQSLSAHEFDRRILMRKTAKKTGVERQRVQPVGDTLARRVPAAQSPPAADRPLCLCVAATAPFHAIITRFFGALPS
jgi:hypothetical protein